MNLASLALATLITFTPTQPNHACAALLAITDYHRVSGDLIPFTRTLSVPCIHPNRIVEPPYRGTLPVMNQFLLPDPNPGVCLMYRIEGVDV